MTTEQQTDKRNDKRNERVARERVERAAWVAKLPSATEMDQRGGPKRRLRWRIAGILGQYEYVRPVGLGWAKRPLPTGEAIARTGKVASLFKRVG